MQNAQIARRLEEAAELLDAQGANEYRVRAYQRAAATVRRLPRAVGDVYRLEGLEGLRKLPGIGPRLAGAIRELLLTRKLPMLERLRGETDPVALLASVPGVGRVTASRLHQDLDIDSLHELEAAANDGRLSEVAGIGKKRLAGIIDSLETRLGPTREACTYNAAEGPPLAELLDVDHEYRELAAAGKLRRIAPRRFNPAGIPWLPILHTKRDGRHYTALYSNTARAHKLGKTHDWVVLYGDHGENERQWTVVTGYRGNLRGKRIVRGLEAECEAFYFGPAAKSAAVGSDSGHPVQGTLWPDHAA
jgi:DNA polymerase (family 10)